MREFFRITSIEMTSDVSYVSYHLNTYQKIAYFMGEFGRLSKEELIFNMLFFNFEYYVQGADGSQAKLEIMDGTPLYVRTKPDNTPLDNLLYLPGGPYYELVSVILGISTGNYINQTNSFSLFSQPPQGIASGAKAQRGLLGGGIIENAMRANVIPRRGLLG